MLNELEERNIFFKAKSKELNRFGELVYLIGGRKKQIASCVIGMLHLCVLAIVCT